MTSVGTRLPRPVAGRIVVPGVKPGDGHEAVTLPRELVAENGPDARSRVRWSPVATIGIVLAVVVLVAVERIGAESGFRTFRYGVAITVLVLILGGIASVLPTIAWREGALLAWNGLGLAIGVLGLGVLGVSSMLALPPVLIGIALTAWPHALAEDGGNARSLQEWALRRRIALVSGLLVVPILALVEWIWLRGGQG